MVARFGLFCLEWARFLAHVPGAMPGHFVAKIVKDLILQDKTRASHPALGPEIGATPSGIGPNLATIYPP